MTKSIKCSDVGVDCDWTASAETQEELMEKIKVYAKEHGFDEITPELADKVQAAIKDQ